MFTVTVDAEQMRKALKDIEQAEKNGFNYCLAVFDLDTYGASIHQCRLKYVDMSERAHPTDGNFNWGRGQQVSKRNKFKNGKLIPIKKRNA